ncbi:uncharacterized protein [Haliotis cracherodii]|uniref:uncharacterized protein n=1 Tax=Haliotis cracherodii TaxID=6455 RepID=UPI0039E89B60
MKHSLILKAFLLSVLTSFTFHPAQSETTVIHCPDVAYLGTSAQITCSTAVNFNNTIYNCPCGAAQHCPWTGCTNISGYNASIINQKQTELTIISVQPQHAGNWSCHDGGDGGNTSCRLVVAKIPSVNITSDVDADSLNLGDKISLTGDIRDYHCSEVYKLTLQVGSATYTRESGRNATIENLTQTVPVNVTQTHFGDVKLVFVCGNHQWNITPEGVNELQQNKTNVQTTIDTGAVSVGSTPTPPDDSKLLLVAGGASLTVCVIIIITIVCCCYRCRKQVNPAETHDSNLPFAPPYISVGEPANTADADVDALRSGNVGPATAKAMPLEQEEAGLRINPVYIGSHAHVMERQLDSAAQADPGSRLGGGDYPETRGEYVGLDRNAAQLSNIYEHLSSYEQIGNL